MASAFFSEEETVMTVKMNYETRKAFDNYLFTKGYLVNWDGENQKDCVRSLYALADVFGIKIVRKKAAAK